MKRRSSARAEPPRIPTKRDSVISHVLWALATLAYVADNAHDQSETLDYLEERIDEMADDIQALTDKLDALSQQESELSQAVTDAGARVQSQLQAMQDEIDTLQAQGVDVSGLNARVDAMAAGMGDILTSVQTIGEEGAAPTDTTTTPDTGTATDTGTTDVGATDPGATGGAVGVDVPPETGAPEAPTP
jgi:uncharacterized protein YoxC